MSGAKKNNRHKHHHPVNEKNLLLATLLNLVITLVEVAGGILSNSLALLSDALHNLSDTFATFIAYIATLISRRKANPSRTFGYKRVEILAAMLNAVILIIISVFLLKEAFARIREPQEVNSMILLVVAMVGLGANLLAVVLLHKDSKKSMNVRAAYVHLIGDSLSSVVVIVAAIAIQLFQVYWVDPIVTLLICVYLIREAYVILKEAVNILMQSTPENLDINRIKAKVEGVPEVKNIHHLHAWSMNEQQIHLEVHIELNKDLKLSEIRPIQQKIEELLKKRFQIHHITLQFEFEPHHNPTLIHQQGQ